MKRLIPVILLLVAPSAFGQFRDTTWGMAELEVINTEGRGPDRRYDGPEAENHSHTLVYFVELLGHEDVVVGYGISDDGKLLFGYYFFSGDFAYRIYAELVRRYGPSVVELGQPFRGGWETSDTFISSTYNEEEDYINVTYRPISITAAEEIKEEAELPL